ncbi:MAG: class I SAM-dependent methyltransferase [Flavihumibacter sp.]
MTETIHQPVPPAYRSIDQETKASGFTMASDQLTCSLLRTLAAAKPGATFLEMGTGTGLSTAWILDGMDENSTLISFDFDEAFLAIARKHLGHDHRLQLVHSDGEAWLQQNATEKFDFIFADTWHGKYLLLNETLALLNPGGFYIVDDMLPQPNWPEGHAQKAEQFIRHLESHPHLTLTKQNWSTGIIIAVKKQ